MQLTYANLIRLCSILTLAIAAVFLFRGDWTEGVLASLMAGHQFIIARLIDVFRGKEPR